MFPGLATAGGLLMATAGDQSRLLREAWPRRLNVAKYWLLIGLDPISPIYHYFSSIYLLKDS